MKKVVFIVVAIIAILAVVICTFIYLPLFSKTLGENGLEWNVSGIFYTIILSLAGVAIPILSLFSIRGLGKEIYSKKKNVVFLILNIIIIILVVLFYFAIAGLSGSGVLKNEVAGAVERLFG
ncbi:MAG: hypothetical protein KJ600_03440 [Nanoarchaeota archaeon]|nr:hypothetical protein [Nanoarchaeota archaeon]